MKHKIEIGESIKEPLMIPIRGLWNQMQNTTSDFVSLDHQTSHLIRNELLNTTIIGWLLSRSSYYITLTYGNR